MEGEKRARKRKGRKKIESEKEIPSILIRPIAFGSGRDCHRQQQQKTTAKSIGNFVFVWLRNHMSSDLSTTRSIIRHDSNEKKKQ